MKALGKVDSEILVSLIKDGRTEFEEIANRADTSEDVIRTHFKELQKSGIIVGASVQINYHKLGYTGIASTLLRVNSQDIQETLNRISKVPNIGPWLNLIYGSPYNIQIISVLKNLRDLERLKQTIYNQNKIIASQVYIWMDARNTPENIIVDSLEKKNEAFFYDTATRNMQDFKYDEVDAQIIDTLAVNGRLPFNKIANKIGLSTQTVARRYKNLRENNLFKTSIQVDPLILGYQAIAEFNINLNDPNETNAVADKFSMMPGVELVLKVNGNFDLAVAVPFKSITDFIDWQKRIFSISNISKVESFFDDFRSRTQPFPSARQMISTF